MEPNRIDVWPRFDINNRSMGFLFLETSKSRMSRLHQCSCGMLSECVQTWHHNMLQAVRRISWRCILTSWAAKQTSNFHSANIHHGCETHPRVQNNTDWHDVPDTYTLHQSTIWLMLRPDFLVPPAPLKRMPGPWEGPVHLSRFVAHRFGIGV